ncbi:MAG: flavin reductase [Candidatus Latescibacteria bacterium]|nr:flavin reductase [bacterium]MBD3424608.1 flavin reductase [Candidatus Latescibacterota bacterium]
MIAQNWLCEKCGNIYLGPFPPQNCPSCGADRDCFKQENEFRFPQGEIEHVITTCWKISYGLYMVSSFDGDNINGQICNAFMQITSDPPRFALGINHKNLTHEYIEKSGSFAVSILGKEDQKIVRRFGYRSGREFDKFKGVPIFRERTGCPILKDALGYIECTIIKEMQVDAGTHSIFVGDVVGGKTLKDQEPMTYAYYHKTKHS